MNPSEGLQTALNEIRETLISDNALYQSQIPLVEHYTSSQVYGQSLLALPSDLRNKFIQSLVNRIAYTKFQMDYFENPLRELANDELPLGAIGQDIYINPARGRVYDINDFAGLLAKYESDVKVEYNELNFDVQFPVTIVRKELEKAFSTWGDFESFLMGISQSLYNGAYIADYNYTRKLITSAYKNAQVKMETFTFSSTPTEAQMKGFITRLRQAYLDFQAPSTQWNAWKIVGGYGKSIVSWSNPRDIIVFINNKLASQLDVSVLANAFNIDKSELLGRVYYVPDFDLKDEEGNVEVDGSKIYGFICDRRWFKIRDKAMFMDEFYNANNRSWQSYLNVIKSFNYSLFANALMLVGEIPTVDVTAITTNPTSSISLKVGETKRIEVITTPGSATEILAITSNDDNDDYVEYSPSAIDEYDKKYFDLTGKAATTGISDVPAYITVTVSGQTHSSVTHSIKVYVTAAE